MIVVHRRNDWDNGYSGCQGGATTGPTTKELIIAAVSTRDLVLTLTESETPRPMSREPSTPLTVTL